MTVHRAAKDRTVLAIIQARMGSVRFPGKVLADIGGKPMVQHVIERVRAAGLVSKTVLATTEDPSDDPLEDLGCKLGVAVFRGSSDDVLDRYHAAAIRFGGEVIVRVTADCPLMDPSIIDRAVSVFEAGGYDHVSTAYPVATFPDGLDVWVFSFEALERTWRQATLASDREHVTTFMWKNPHLFRLSNIKHVEDLSHMRWTVDEEVDIRLVREVQRHLGNGTGRIFGMGEILDLLARHPEISRLNSNIGRDEGLVKSVSQDDPKSIVDASPRPPHAER